MATGANLGAATFTVQANTAPFQQGLRQAQQQAQAAGAAIGQQLNRGTNMAALGFLELSRAVEDAQYGFRSVVNNIPQMVMLFGGSAGLAGAVSIAAVGINQLIQHWDDLKDAMQAAWSGSTVEQLRKVREEAEAAAESFAKLAKTPTELQKAGAEMVTKAIVEGDVGKVLEGVAAGIAAGPRGATEKEAYAETTMDRIKLVQQPGLMQAAIDEVNRKRAAALIERARGTGPEAEQARKEIEAMARKNPGGFPAGFAGAMAGASPEALASRKRGEMLEKEGRENEQAMRDRQRREDERARKDDMLNREGQRNEEHMRAEQARQQRERMQAARELDQEERHNRHLKWQVADIMKAARPERTRAEMMGFAEFARFTQVGILNNPVEIAKRQLDALEKIRRLLEDNPAQKGLIMKAVAAEPN